MKKFLCFLGILTIAVLCFSACGSKADPESDFEVKPIDGGKSVEITGYIGTKWEVRIPAKIQKLPVTNIGERAFREKNLISATIPNSVTKIGDGAFENNQLTSIILPNGVMMPLILPDGTVIPEDGFPAIAPDLFKNNKLTGVTIPSGVTMIRHGAFENNQLTSVTMPDSVTTIEFNAFANNQLTSLTLHEGVIEIGEKAFENNQLASVTIPDSVTEIGYCAFNNNQLTSITIGADVNLGNHFRYSPLGFSIEFDSFYRKQGQRAGTYTLDNDTWTAEFR